MFCGQSALLCPNRRYTAGVVCTCVHIVIYMCTYCYVQMHTLLCKLRMVVVLCMAQPIFMPLMRHSIFMPLMRHSIFVEVHMSSVMAVNTVICCCLPKRHVNLYYDKYDTVTLTDTKGGRLIDMKKAVCLA